MVKKEERLTSQESERRPGKLGSGPNENQAAGQVSNVTFLLFFLTLEPEAGWDRVFHSPRIQAGHSVRAM